ncbi:hypothetical protein AALO_G00071550 [Alosa alosa]|uniref:Uncharacterized protein n=1 Tax=Alosa alosa TaxID=278164 RepID=A0AAV6H5Q4_9TELE|nr:hypothetical protein AALO_G00071550 [Alosa alosa]
MTYFVSTSHCAADCGLHIFAYPVCRLNCALVHPGHMDLPSGPTNGDKRSFFPCVNKEGGGGCGGGEDSDAPSEYHELGDSVSHETFTQSAECAEGEANRFAHWRHSVHSEVFRLDSKADTELRFNSD